MCLGCRQRSDPVALVRVVAEGGKAVVDERRRKPGRGAWVHPQQQCIEKATRSLARALRTERLDLAPATVWVTEKVHSDHDRRNERPMDIK